MRKRNNIVFLRLNDTEFEHLQTQVALSCLSREGYLRALVLREKIYQHPCSHHIEAIHKLAGLCHNANQLAYIENRTGRADPQRIAEMVQYARKAYEKVLAQSACPLICNTYSTPCRRCSYRKNTSSVVYCGYQNRGGTLYVIHTH